MECMPLSSASNILQQQHHHHPMTSAAGINGATAAVVLGGSAAYQHHLNLNHHHHPLLTHHSPYSNHYQLHHSGAGVGVVGSHQQLHTEQTKSLQELQHEVGALLEFRDLVIETFPDLKHKMASMSSSSSAAMSSGATAVMGGTGVACVSGTNTLISSTSLASRREWEPGIRIKRKLSQKEHHPSTASVSIGAASGSSAAAVVAELSSSSSLSRSRSNSHSGKKEPKSGENNNGSVVQDSGFSTETSSSKEGHSASSTNGALTVRADATSRLVCAESDDELMNLLDVIHRKSNRLREEVEHLQNYERQNLRGAAGEDTGDEGARALTKSSSSGSSTTSGGLTPKTFREHVERLNKEDIKQLRKERDRLLNKLAEMEAETLTGRIKAAKMSDQVEQLIGVKKDLEEQLKLAMAQKLELSCRVQQYQQQQPQQHQHSKTSSSQSDYSSQRLNFLSSASTVLSTGSSIAPPTDIAPRQPNTFQPVIVTQDATLQTASEAANRNFFAFHQSASSDSRQQAPPLGRLDGIVSTPGGRNSKCRATDAKRFQAILLETNVLELQRHLLTLTVQNQVLAQKLDVAAKSKTHLTKRLDKSRDDMEDLKFQLEERNIELEGTKAQLRVLEARMQQAAPPNSGTSYTTHSQHDYETNRSSASTTLMPSRRGANDSHSSLLLMSSSTASSLHAQPPPPTQISTPSMKAMTHLPMDELQQHSSSTESAHELQHELPQSPPQLLHKLMSTSVGGTSPFAAHFNVANGARLPNAKRYSVAAAASKPSKIPLPGSKTSTTVQTPFAAKPPTGRAAIARSPPSAAHSSAGSNASSSKSSLSRSTGNLLYSKSPNSLKRADSAQSIRSTNTNNSRSSTSSIPLATTPHAPQRAFVGAPATPSARALQNSPLPKPKRDSLTSRVRHLDSVSRQHHHHHQQQHNSNDSNSSASNNNSYLVASTPKTSIASQLSSTQLRKDLQLSSNSFSNGSQQFLRRATGAANTANVVAAAASNVAASNTRRFSNASVMSSRIAGRMQQEAVAGGHNVSSASSHSTSSTSSASEPQQQQQPPHAHSADTDSGKKLNLLAQQQMPFTMHNDRSGNAEQLTTGWRKIAVEPQNYKFYNSNYNNDNNNNYNNNYNNNNYNNNNINYNNNYNNSIHYNNLYSTQHYNSNNYNNNLYNIPHYNSNSNYNNNLLNNQNYNNNLLNNQNYNNHNYYINKNNGIAYSNNYNHAINYNSNTHNYNDDAIYNCYTVNTGFKELVNNARYQKQMKQPNLQLKPNLQQQHIVQEQHNLHRAVATTTSPFNRSSYCQVTPLQMAQLKAEEKTEPHSNEPDQETTNNMSNNYSNDVINESWFESFSSDDVGAGNDNLLVTFDYGHSADSIERQTTDYEFNEPPKAGEDVRDRDDGQVWLCAPQLRDDAAPFTVHRMRHTIKEDEVSCTSSLIEYNVNEEELDEVYQTDVHYSPHIGFRKQRLYNVWEMRETSAGEEEEDEDTTAAETEYDETDIEEHYNS